MNMNLAQISSLSPQHLFQFSNLRRQTGECVPRVLKFGSSLQNAVLANSKTKAVLPLQQLALLHGAEKKSPDSIPPEHSTKLFLKQESKVCKVENGKYLIPQDIIPTETEKKEAEFLSITNSITEQQFGNNFRIQHQKQTSSQLIHFLRTNRNMKCFSFAGSEKGAFELKQQLKGKTETNMDQEFIQWQKTHNKPRNNSACIFTVKNSCAGSVTYRCVIATNSELWDIGDISTEVKNPLASIIESLTFADCNYSCIMDPFTQSFCISSNESMAHQCGIKGVSSKSVDRSSKIEATGKIPEFQIKKFEEIPIVVTHVVSPNNFYIQLKDNSLQELSEIIVKKNSKSYGELNCIPDIGAYVMGWYAEQKLWCRAQVTKICGMNHGSGHLCINIEVEIRRIDYGDLTCLSLWKIKQLCGEVAKIPAQALQVSLADVKPVNGKSWSTEAVSWFKDKVNKRTLYARLYPAESRVIVELFLEKGKIGAMRRSSCLSLRLTHNGHARHERMNSMHLKKSYAHKQSRKHSAVWEKYMRSCIRMDIHTS
ncbi:uncharacterized protein LOC124386391 [Silurus meridionalis]|uniref:Tudor domain-containing protein n=1 Tax=Silurus meridionalis TaxID=175797 RepID=A0A8T0BIV9_SILME|nr:uncharacterized protein LOC124386391 [Silurus meridionalis]KAF7707202.1 hypothetical protein HF521_018420 [Silurus meridionalis]